jgi:hypothetical protein
MNLSDIKCKLKHYISTIMVICGSYMVEFSVSKGMRKKDIVREVAIGKVVAHLCRNIIKYH